MIAADLVVGFEFETFRNPRMQLAGKPTMQEKIGSYVAFRPRGLTLIIPLRNSTNVPLVTVNKRFKLENPIMAPYRLIGISKSAM